MALKKYLKIISVFAKLSLMFQTAHRGSFFLAVLAKSLRMGLLLVFFQAIYLNVNMVAGWSFREIFLLVLSFLTSECLAIITFHRNLFYYFPKMLKSGDFDLVLAKPINPLFYSAFRVIDIMDLSSFAFVIFLWIYFFTHFPFAVSISTIFVYIFALSSGIIFLFSLTLFLASTCFWVLVGQGLGRFFEGVVRMARYPTNIFNGFLRTFFFYIFPIATIATVPARVLTGVIEIQYLIFAFVFSLILLFFSLKFWNFALRHYSSASS